MRCGHGLCSVRTFAPIWVGRRSSFCTSHKSVRRSAFLRTTRVLKSRRSLGGGAVSVERSSQVLCADGSTLVRFRTRRKLGPLEFFKITGSIGCLGDWDRNKAPRMVPYGEDVWELDVMVPSGSEMNFTCVVNSDGAEDGEQVTRSIVVNNCERLEVDFDFGQEESLRVTEVGGRAEGGGFNQSGEGDVTRGWQGKDIRFMTSNEHPRERAGSWRADHLEGVGKQFIMEDQKAGSWLRKLEVAKRRLVDESPDRRPELEAVAFAHVYLSWINQGLIPCVESGGHRRPNHHAKEAMQLFRSLEWVIEPGRKDKRLVWIARKLQTTLPSFSSEYTRSEPLTRIRDIAHRNDIPKDLKHQIKHTIQNKLHRNAGPEDLVASEILYEQILDDKDNLSSDFVHQFGLFLAELRDFFNAGTLTQLLRKIGPSLVSADDSTHVIDRFLSLQKELDSNGFQTSGLAAQQNKIIETLHAVTTVRSMICSRLHSGLRNDAPDSAMSMRQFYRLAEVRTEEYAFVLLSRFINLVEASGGFEGLEASSDQSWALQFGALILGLRHLSMDGWEPQECMALENELTAWQKEGNVVTPLNALRVKATLERLQRLSEDFCDSLLEELAPRAQSLAVGLNVSDHQAQVFAESEIRASIVFQLSKLNAHLLRASRKASNQSAWDMLVPGTAIGTLLAVNSLDSRDLPRDVSGDVVLLVRRADGDEDVAHLVAGTSSGMNVTGIILCQELPHLSHLGVRARQEKLVFASCWDNDVLDSEVRSLTGENVKLDVGAGGVTLVRHEGRGRSDNGRESQKKGPVRGNGGKVRGRSGLPFVLPQLDAESDTCGAKAGNCKVLQVISEMSGKFEVPKGAVLPFGSMQKSWNWDVQASVESTLVNIDDILFSGETGDVLDTAIRELHEMIHSQPPPMHALYFLGSFFSEGSKVIVRSSSNMEDMEGMSGAGLHDSIANVDPSNADELGAAITAVWASLHTKRAFQSRIAAGMYHSDADMGVLIQQQLSPDVSFVLHTTDPISKNSEFLQAEIAPGIGETLASGARGTPWRLLVNKKSGEVETEAFGNFSHILMPSGAEGKGRMWKPVDAGQSDGSGVVFKVADYSIQPLTIEEDKRDLIGKMLVDVGELLEQKFEGRAQDVEGAIVGNDVYIVQSRPQPM
ncbi:hypothetical protein BSKO_09962 [Bryopsis sp. KO-2023]|nr:hypothetical protein BSKO_09962 [Bryopsis sp. KO-2023]